MTKDEALKLIEDRRNELVDLFVWPGSDCPISVEMLNWTRLRVVILNFTDEEWTQALIRAERAPSA